MHQLQRVSWALTILGVAMTAIAILGDLDAIWLLSGLLLTWAGVVKIAVTLVWTRVAQMGTEDHNPVPGP